MEEWRDVIGFEGLYKVSNTGKIMSLINNKGKYREKIMKVSFDGFGYLKVMLYKNGKKKTSKIHILVAQAFLKNPHNLPEVNHKDEDKQNNCVENLEWCTSKYNINYGTRSMRMSITQGKPIIGINIINRKKIRFNSAMEAGRNGFSQGNISMCLHNKRNNHKGYIWKYESEDK